MTRRWTTLALLAVVASVPAASGCGGDSDTEAGSTTKTAGDRSETASRSKAIKDARRETEDRKREERELKELEDDDREFDKSFEESPFERAVQKLPIREPPLYVEQYITGEGHKVYTAVNEKRFCKTTRAEREKAVSSFYRNADRLLRRAGVKDFSQVVSPLSSTADDLPVLATGRAGRVSLSQRGRRC